VVAITTAAKAGCNRNGYISKKWLQQQEEPEPVAELQQ
jgi:hypothetical protein